MKLRIFCLMFLLLPPAMEAATVTMQGGQTNQVVDGFGVNANYRNWNGAELTPVLDALIDQAGMTLFRVVHDLSDWEATNDNADANVMNWGYYNPVYGAPDFTRLWDLFGYLNARGITNGAFLNFMGWGPDWLGGNALILSPGLEDEWAEMITSLLVYARNTRGLQFHLVAPDNEPDLSSEGIRMATASQYTKALHQLAVKLDANGLSDVKLIGPDLASGGTVYFPELMADPVIMAKLAHFGVHSYSGGGGGSGGVLSFIQGSAYPDRTFWMTEFNVWCNGCDSGTRGTYDWAYCVGTADYLLNHLLNGASACFPWEGYDSYYLHHGAWSFWGLFAVDDENAAVKTYTPRKNFYTVAQISKWVRPGAQRINLSGTPAPFSPLLAFKHTGLGQVTLVGINPSGSAAPLNGTLVSLGAVPSLNLYYTSATTNLANGGSVLVNNGTFSVTIPADCVFTLTGFTGVQVALTNPVNGAQFNAPATIPLAAAATTTAGNIARVGFYHGAIELGEASNAPYALTWTNVPMGDYALSAIAGDTLGNAGTSAVVNLSVAGDVARIGVSPANASVVPGGTQQFTATGSDALGHVLNPPPAFSWSVSGGGTMSGTGLFTAGGATGGPFNVVAGSGGVTGTAAVHVNAYGGGGMIGNASAGTLSDTIWGNGASINAGRFQAASNLMVTTIFANVGAVAGSYKCALYTDDSGQPGRLLGATAEVSNPTSDWQSFPLGSLVGLTNGSYYWLAIWSDDANARVYYSDNNGTLRWGAYNYGAWPDPIITTGGNALNYCIYATNTSWLLAVTSVLLPAAKVGVAYSFQMTASGGIVPYRWAMPTNAALPPGLTLATNGILSGVPSAAGPFNFPVVVADAAGMATTQNVSLGIAAPVLTLGVLPQSGDEIASLGFRMTFSADAPGTYLIQRTGDFKIWEAVRQVGYTNGVLPVTDPDAATNQTQYYRAMRP